MSLTYENYWAQPSRYHYGVGPDGFYLETFEPEDAFENYSLTVPYGWEARVFYAWRSFDRNRPLVEFRDHILDLYQADIRVPILPRVWSKGATSLWYGTYWSGHTLKPFAVYSAGKVPLRLHHAWHASPLDNQAGAELIRLLNDHAAMGSIPTGPWSGTTIEQAPRPLSEDSPLTPGRICLKDDGQKVHMVVWMGHQNGRNNLLVLTSNPRWCPNCRRITKDEMAAVGFAYRNPEGYLAPYQTGDDVIPTNSTLSELRLEALEAEFQGRYLDDDQLKQAWETRVGISPASLPVGSAGV